MKESAKHKGFGLKWISEYRKELFGVAILSIMFFHFTIIHLGYYKGGQSFLYAFTKIINKYIGSAGVDIFVFLSGVGLYYSFSKNQDVLNFYSRRYKRILVPYVIVGSAYWLFADIIYTDLGFSRWLEDFLYITFIREGINNFWFIAFIGSMYLVFPILYKAFFECRRGRILFLLIIFAAFAVPICIYTKEHDVYSRLNIALTRIPMFIAGTYTGRFIKESRHIPHSVAVTMILAGLACRYYVTIMDIKGPLNRYATGLLAISLILLFIYVIRLLQNVKLLRKAICFFGKYSLELYLLHVALWGILAGAGATLYRPGSYMMLICAAMIMAPLLSKMTAFITKKGHTAHDRANNDAAIK